MTRETAQAQPKAAVDPHERAQQPQRRLISIATPSARAGAGMRRQPYRASPLASRSANTYSALPVCGW